jgi:hypothetical protein
MIPWERVDATGETLKFYSYSHELRRQDAESVPISVLEAGGILGYHATQKRKRCFVLTYKVVEISTVTEDIIEETLNEWTARGWRFDGMQFAMREASRRPSMAFVIFTRETEEA